MTLQSTVSDQMGFGVPGEEFLAGPRRAQPGIIDSDGVTNGPTRVGYAFTNVAGADGHMTLGGVGVFAGWLANPKVYPERGSVGDTLAPSLDLPQYAEAEFLYDSTGMNCELGAAANIGDLVYYNTTTGAPVTQPKTGNVAGAGRGALQTHLSPAPDHLRNWHQ